jgi:hypothetical protein
MDHTTADGVVANTDDALAREAWGWYVDRFARRNGEWRVTHRTVVLEALSSYVAQGGGALKDGAGGSATVWTDCMKLNWKSLVSAKLRGTQLLCRCGSA